MAHSVAHEGLSSNKAPLFDGSNYVLWRVRMEAYLMSLGFDVWQFVVMDEIIENPPEIRQGGEHVRQMQKVGMLFYMVYLTLSL